MALENGHSNLCRWTHRENGPIVESLMPFVDDELFPKMNGQFETSNDKGKKKATSKSEEEGHELARNRACLGH